MSTKGGEVTARIMTCVQQISETSQGLLLGVLG
jgi:hypothetical protein